MKKQEKSKKKALFSPYWWLVDLIRVTAAPTALPWYRVKHLYENEEARKKIKGGALLISNHVSFTDPINVMITVWYRRHRFICMKEFFEGNPVKCWFFRNLRCIPIDRENFNLASFREIIDVLKSGELVSIFPEGHIDGSGDGTEHFKSGMVMMALQSKAPVIPVYIRKKEHWYSRLVAAIGAPIDVEKLYREKPSFTRVTEISTIIEEKEDELGRIASAYGKGKKA